MLVTDFDYSLPPDRIAQRPTERRDASRMMLLDRSRGAWRDAEFAGFADVLQGNELLVFNNAKVIPARLFGHRAGVHSQKPAKATRREHLTGEVEVFLTKRRTADSWEALVRPGRKMKVGERVLFGGGELEAEIISRGELGLRVVRFSSKDDAPIMSHIERLGHIPLPPYIEREDETADRERYQTIFAKRSGAVAAPTAGLHFSTEMIDRLHARNIEMVELTLDVGLGTFQPIHSEQLERHVMHCENYEIPDSTAAAIERARRGGRPIVAIGTTVVRALENSATRNLGNCLIVPGGGDADIFITPGYSFKAVDALLTNFHLPQSTLLALVCAFAGRESVLAAYRHAVESGYRFYSYGDCMFIR